MIINSKSSLKGFLFLLCFSISANYFSQITIGSSDMPQLGESYVYSTASLFEEYDLNTGEDYSWDYSFLSSTSYDSLVYVPISDAPFTYQLLFNNPFFPAYYADFATTSPDIDLGGFSLTNSYQFYQNNADDYRILGMGVEVNSFPGVGQSNPIDIVYEFPMSFGSMDTSYSEMDIEIIGLGNYHAEQTRMNEVDGWGEITIPLGTFDCLRVKTTLNGTDSIYTSLLDFGFSLDRPETVEYKWLANGEGIPVLTVVETAGFISQINYLDTLVNEVDFIEIYEDFKLETFPNPTNDILTISSNKNPIQEITIHSASGVLVDSFKVFNEDVVEYAMSELESGQYILTIKTKYMTSQEMIIKR